MWIPIPHQIASSHRPSVFGPAHGPACWGDEENAIDGSPPEKLIVPGKSVSVIVGVEEAGLCVLAGDFGGGGHVAR